MFQNDKQTAREGRSSNRKTSWATEPAPRPHVDVRKIQECFQHEAAMSSARQTTDHQEIRRWIEEREGTPSRVKDSPEGGLLRVDFGEQEERLERMDWEEFFSVFEKSDLAFLHQDRTADGKISRFNKFVSRS
ncbi:hypothetical protein [Rhizobium wuzhouense]